MSTEGPTSATGGPTCAEVQGSLAELALGSLAGDERVGVLVHLQSCERCRAEGQRLALTADALLLLAPGAEPPVGFEVRLFQRMGVSGPTPVPQEAGRRVGGRIARLSGRGRAMVAAAAAVVAVAAGFGGGWLASTPAPTPVASPTTSSSPAQGAPVATAALRSGSHDVGTVSTFAGRPGWMLMTMHGVPASGAVTCEVTVVGGRRIRAGSFRLDDGYGAWGARLPVAAEYVRSTRVVTPSGAVVASATLPRDGAKDAPDRYPR